MCRESGPPTIRHAGPRGTAWRGKRTIPIPLIAKRVPSSPIDAFRGNPTPIWRIEELAVLTEVIAPARDGPGRATRSRTKRRDE